jgi:hypothetical protein
MHRRNGLGGVVRILLFCASVALALMAPSLASARINWTGPGWYLELVDMDTNKILFLVSGPFPTNDACMADEKTHHEYDKDADTVMLTCWRYTTDHPYLHG